MQHAVFIQTSLIKTRMIFQRKIAGVPISCESKKKESTSLF